jgi:polyhydroxyalkanoate synthesis regulator phasin
MTRTIEMLEARINLLEQSDAVANANIIKKLKRQIRRLEK